MPDRAEKSFILWRITYPNIRSSEFILEYNFAKQHSKINFEFARGSGADAER